MNKSKSGDNLPDSVDMDAMMKVMMGEQEKPKENKEIKLLTRSGSDPQYDNIEYLAKIEK